MQFGTVTMEESMRRWRPVLLVLCFVGSSSLLVSSQTTPSSSDSCTTALSLGSLLPFNTTAGLACFPAWTGQDFVLRFGKDASGSNVWNFVLSAPDSGGYVAVGFSPNGKMVGSSAVAGWVPAGKAGTARQHYLGGTSSSSCPPDQGKLTLSRGVGPTIVSKNSRLYLAFQLSSQPLTNVIYAVGPSGSLPGPNGLLVQHLAMATGTISLSGSTSGGGAGGTPATGGGGDGDGGHEGHEGGEGKGNSDQSGGVGGESGSNGTGGRSTTTATASATSSSARILCAQWTKCSIVVQILAYFVFFSATIFF